MNAEDMVRALGYIDDRYIEEAENAKLSTSGIWLRVGSVAACLCVLILVMHSIRQPPAQAQGDNSRGPAGGAAVLHDASEVAAESSTSERTYGDDKPDKVLENSCAGMEPKNYLAFSQEIRTDGGCRGLSYPLVTVLRSREELTDYCRAQSALFDLEPDFLEACEGYDDAYFAENDLVLICLEENSGSITHRVTDVYAENSGWIITVERHVPDEKTDDMAQWHILVEIQMGKVIAPEETVTVRLETKEN